MNISSGWIERYRCLLRDAVYQNSTYFHRWVTLLLMDARKEHEFVFNNRIQKLKPDHAVVKKM